MLYKFQMIMIIGGLIIMMIIKVMVFFLKMRLLCPELLQGFHFQSGEA